MAKKNKGIGNVAPIGVANIDVYHVNKRKFDNSPSFLFLLLAISFCLVFAISCQNKKEAIPENKFWWEAGISAPKYYPISDSKVDFGLAGNSCLTNFDNGWGQNYAAIVSANIYKSIPDQVAIQYYSAVEVLKFEGIVKLPREKILALFKKYCKNREKDEGYLVVGMAPGGWVRVWVHFSTMKNAYFDNIEIAKTQLKGFEDKSISQEFREKNLPYWDKYKTYWEHFGTPYEAWAENEKKYTLLLNLNKPNNPKYNVASQYYSLDGTDCGSMGVDHAMKTKLPADLIISWWQDKDSTSYDTHVLMPKNFAKIVQDKKTDKVEISLEIEDNSQFGVLYLITNGRKEKILRFKNEKSNSSGLGESNFSDDVEYYLK